MEKMNKKADIAITILVIGIFALCVLTLLSFHLAGSRQIKGVVKSAYFLQDIYNLADSINYSGVYYLNNYRSELKDYSITESGNEVVIEKTYFKKDLGLAWGKGDEVIKVKYSFMP
jgi:hypothetical protein